MAEVWIEGLPVPCTPPSNYCVGAANSTGMGAHAFVNGTTLILWAWATWWIPLLVIFGIWRHVVRKVPLTYSPMYWSLVFPLGMYTVATWQFATADNFSFMKEIPSYTIWIALTAWLVTATGLVRSIFRRPTT